MNNRMEQEMIQAIQSLRASMPNEKGYQASIGTLLHLAVEEMSALLLLALFAVTILLGTAVAHLLSKPMLITFCTAPLPALSLFHRYVLHNNKPMKELEETFLYTYTEMLISRVMVISIYMAGVLSGLSLLLHYTEGESFIRLALCGAIPSVYLCGLLLFLGGVAHQKENISIVVIVLWIAFVSFSVYLPVDQFLCQFSSATYSAVIGIGLIFYALNIYRIKGKRRLYVVDL